MSKRTKLIQQTKLVVKRLKKQQTQANRHQANLYQWFKDHQILLAALLIPVVIISVKRRDKIQIKDLLRKVRGFVMVTTVAAFKKSITQTLSNKL